MRSESVKCEKLYLQEILKVDFCIRFSSVMYVLTVNKTDLSVKICACVKCLLYTTT